MSKKTKLIFICICSIYSFCLFGYLKYWNSISEQESQQFNNFFVYATELSDNISDQFYERYHDCLSFATSIKDTFSNKEVLVRNLNRFTELFSIYDLILVTDLNGNYVASNTSRADGTPININELKKLNYKDQIWFKKTINKEFTEDKEKKLTDVYVGDPNLDELVSVAYGNDHYTNSFNALIRNNDGKPIGIMSIRVNFSWVENEFVELYERLSTHKPSTIEMTLIDKAGAILVDYAPYLKNKDKFVHHDYSVLNKFNLVSNNVTAALSASKGIPGVVLSQHARRGVEQVSGFSPIKSERFVDSIGWSILVRADSSEVMAPIWQSKSQFTISLTLFILIVVFTTTFLLVYSKEKDAQELALTQAKLKSEDAANVKATFLANMSHEIRTPLNGIIGISNLLLSSTNDAKQSEYLNLIHSSGNNLLTLLNDILDFSKLEANKVELDTNTFSLHKSVSEVLELLKPFAAEKSLTLNYEISQLPNWIQSDNTKIKQILSNLIANAIKFTGSGSVSVTGSGKKIKNNKLLIQFAVKDSGVGIPEHLQSKLFQSFSQVDASTTRKYGGTGLGLAISKGLCEILGGDITLSSTLGQGSTFMFYFIASSALENSSTISELPFSNFDPDLGKKLPLNILVAEDNKTNQVVTLGVLKKMGYQADLAENGEEVLSKTKNINYDIIFMDCQMPVLDGYETTRILRKTYRDNPRPKIIALTASHLSSEVKLCLECGMDECLSKPISLTDFYKCVKTIAVSKHSPIRDLKSS